MSQNLQQLISNMSPGALRLYKQQLSILPEIEKQRAFSRLSGIPELADIVGTPEKLITAQPQQRQPVQPSLIQPQQQPQQVKMPWELTEGLPWWQAGLEAFAMPFNVVGKGFGALVSAPFTPATPETQAMPWWKKELVEYEQTKMPWGVKGTLEILPWLAIPAIGAVGKAGTIAGGLGKLGTAGKVAGRALQFSPWGLSEKAAGLLLRPAGKILAKAIGKTGKPIPSQIWGKLTKTERAVVAKQLGLAETVGQRAWSRLGKRNQDVVSKAILNPTEEILTTGVKKAVRGATAPIKPKIVSKLFPEGFDAAQEKSITKLNELVKASKPRTKATLLARKPEQAKRIGEFTGLFDKYAKELGNEEWAFNKAKQVLKGKYPEVDVDAIVGQIRTNINPEDFQNLWKIVREAPYVGTLVRKGRSFQRKQNLDWLKLNTTQALQDLFDENLLQRNQILLLERVFGSDLAKALLKQRSFGARAGEFVIELANAPRAMLASMDISGFLRQGAILYTRQPIKQLQAIKPMLHAMLSDNRADLMDDVIRTMSGMDELINPALRSKGLTELSLTANPAKIAAKILEREEPFIGVGLVEKIPIIGALVKASNRAYVTVLNSMRAISATSTLNSWKKAGLKFTQKSLYGNAAKGTYGLGDISDLNQLVNWASGRGALPEALSKHTGLLSTMFFSPNYVMSRVRFPTAVLPSVTKSALVRKEAWKQTFSFIGAVASILTLAKLSGQAEVEIDPRSADFGKLKIGETRLDIWSGYAQYLRFIAQLATAERKTSGGRIQLLNRGEIITRFARSKLSPTAGLLTDFLAGETYLGESLPPKSAKSVLGQVYQRTMPLAIQDMIDAVQQDGIAGGIVSSVGLLGVGVVTYTDETKRARNKAAQDKYGMSWEEVGRTYGRATQLTLEQESPEIIEATKEQEERFATGTPTKMQQWHNEGQGVEDTYRKSIELAVKEFKATRDGRTFRDKTDNASYFRRQAYASRAGRKEYQEIIDYYNQPLDPSKVAEMNPGDVIRREYYQQLFSPEMYDEFGNYRFDIAEIKEREFLVQYGQQALDYIEEYRGARWLDKPVELKMLEQARDTLRPYWNIADQVWALYPKGLKEFSDQIVLMERTDPQRARQMLRKYPMILRARELIARYKKQMRRTNPEIDRAYRLFY